MASDGSALVLLHGATMSGRVWQDVIPLLSGHHQVYAPTALGHRGGPPFVQSPVTADDVVDVAERYLDELGLERPHLAGNSMGGAMAIELARRGRAATVCALSPAGFWTVAEGSHIRPLKRVVRAAAMARRTRAIAPFVLKSAAARRMAFRDIACHGDRITLAQALEACDDAIGCAVFDELCSTVEDVTPLDPLPCPIMLAWSEKDVIFPVATYGRTARERLPKASFTILPGVGHVPMIDDPALVARTILAVTSATQQ